MWWTLFACVDLVGPDVGVGSAPGVEVDVDVDADADADGTGDIDVTVALALSDGSLVSCEDAGVAEIAFELHSDEVMLPCDGAPTRWFAVPAGQGILAAHADSGFGVYFEGHTTIEVAADGATAVDLTLDCEENTGAISQCTR